MKMRVEVVTVNTGDSEQRSEVLAIERHELGMERLGMSLVESKSLLSRVQNYIVEQQVDEDLERRPRLPSAA